MSNEHVVVGIDLGSSRFVVAVVKGSGVEVLVNQSSYRQTPTAVVFGEQRTTGDKATALIKKDLENTIFNPERFLGELTHQALQHEMNFNFCQPFFQSQNVVNFEVRLGSQKGSIRAEQLVAGLFSEAMGILQFNEIQPKEVVVSVPDAFGQSERVSLLSAARVSGLPITRLLNESSANALNYSVFRRNEFDGEVPRIVCFVDVGHSKTTIAFAAITSAQIEMLNVHTHNSLGIRDLDLFLLRHYSNQLKQRFQIDVFQQKKLQFKLMEAIAKQRTTLTINADAQLTLECVDGDTDFTCLLKRDDFDKIGATFFKAIKQTFDAAYASLPKAQAKAIHSVERIGGGCRMPAIERLITQCFKVPQVSKTLDASESIARGCALQSAMMAPKFMHTGYKIKERLQYPITVKMQFEGEEAKGQTLFEVGSDFCRRVNVVVSRPETLTLGVCLPSKANFEEHVSSYTTIPARNPGQELTIYFVLDHNGIVSIENAVLKGQRNTPSKSGTAQPLALNIVKPGELSAQELDAFQRMEVHLLRQEIEIKEREAARNRLESLIYATKAELNEGIGGWGPGEIFKLSQRIEELETWLYGPGAASDRATLDQEIDNLQDQIALHSGRSASFEASKATSAELEAKLKQINDHITQKWKSLSPQIIQKAQSIIQEAEALLYEFASLKNRFSCKLLLSFDFNRWTQSVQKSLQSLDQLGTQTN